MKLFPTLVIDDFLDDPDYLSDLARSVEYKDPSYTNHPGVASKNAINEIEPELFGTIHRKLLSVCWDLTKPVSYNTVMDFMKIEYKHDGVLNNGIVHVDSESGSTCAGVIYLNKDLHKDAGTSFYRRLDDTYTLDRHDRKEFLDSVARHHAGENVEGIEKIMQDHRDKFEETMRVQNQYNRLLTYGSDVYHAHTSCGRGQTRYTLRFFMDLESKHQDYPLRR